MISRRGWEYKLAAVVVGAAAGFALALSCSGATPCGPSNCDGCCQEGTCVAGDTHLQCGSGGADCTKCGVGQNCVDHQCASPPPPPPVDAGCDVTCVNGCCDDAGVCHGGNQPSACGTSGAACAVCDAGQACVLGACGAPARCTGCVDALGTCRSGTQNGACGADGGLCKACFAADRCQSGDCVIATCLPSSCDAGCCSAAGCVDPPTDQQCGVAGRTCVACNTAAGEHCVKGECAGPPCSPATCDAGCCSSTGCVVPDDFRCGSAGGACVACRRDAGEQCIAGACSVPVADAGVDAGVDAGDDGGVDGG